MEVWKSDDGKLDGKNLTHRGVFSLIVACLQYLLPLLIVLGIYGLIYRFLREQQYPRHLRQNKTNALLASISITHCIIWLPFSVFNILADLWPDTVSFCTMFENHRKSLILHCEQRYIYVLSGQKLIENAKNVQMLKNGSFWQFFENLKLAVKQCYQTGQKCQNENSNARFW